MILKFVVYGIWSLVNEALNGNYDLLENNGFSSTHTEIMNQQNKGIEISTRQDRFRVEITLVTTNTVTARIDIVKIIFFLTLMDILILLVS